MSNTIWRVAPCNASFHPAILCRCKDCGIYGTQQMPPLQFFDGRNHIRSTVESGTELARNFFLTHKPLCPRFARQHAEFEAVDKQLDAARGKIEQAETKVLTAERALEQGYIIRRPVAELVELDKQVHIARAEATKVDFTSALRRLEAEVEAAKNKFESERREFVPEATIVEFQTAMSRYLPHANAEPLPPGVEKTDPYGGRAVIAVE